LESLQQHLQWAIEVGALGDSAVSELATAGPTFEYIVPTIGQ
jgi:hypothetical protein